MKIKYITFLFTVSYIISYGQSVGINKTVSPTDVAKVVVSTQTAGNNATVKFQTTAKTPTAGQVLMSDNLGNATWQTYEINPNALYSAVSVQYASPGFEVSTASNGGNIRSQAFYTGANITVPEGVWAVYATFKVNATSETTGQPATATSFSAGESIWVRLLLDDDDSTVPSYSAIRANPYLYDITAPWNPAYLISGEITGPNSNGLLKGEIYLMNCNMTNLRGDVITVKNTPFYFKLNTEMYNNPSGKTYRVKNAGAAPSVNGENRIVAIYAGKCPVTL